MLSLDFLNRCQIRGCLHPPWGGVCTPFRGVLKKKIFATRTYPPYLYLTPPTFQILEISLGLRLTISRVIWRWILSWLWNLSDRPSRPCTTFYWSAVVTIALFWSDHYHHASAHWPIACPNLEGRFPTLDATRIPVSRGSRPGASPPHFLSNFSTDYLLLRPIAPLTRRSPPPPERFG